MKKITTFAITAGAAAFAASLVTSAVLTDNAKSEPYPTYNPGYYPQPTIEEKSDAKWTPGDKPMVWSCADWNSSVEYTIDVPIDTSHPTIARMENARNVIGGISEKPNYFVVNIDATNAAPGTQYMSNPMWANENQETVEAVPATELLSDWVSALYGQENADGSSRYSEMTARTQNLKKDLSEMPTGGAKGYVVMVADRPITTMAALSLGTSSCELLLKK